MIFMGKEVNTLRNKKAWRLAVYGLLTAVMMIFSYIESQIVISAAMPGVKLGLSNTVLIYGLYMLGNRGTVILMIAKVLLNGFMFSNPSAMIYSLAGGLVSLILMMLVKNAKDISTVGVSVVGALGHNLGQLIVAAIVLGTYQWLIGYAPILLIAAVITGVITGIVANRVLFLLDKAKK